MTSKELVLKITEYIDSSDECPEHYVFTRLIELLNDGFTTFVLEEGGTLSLSYEEGNSPIIRLTEGAELDFRLVQHISTWLDHQWRQSGFTILRPYRTGSVITLRKKRNTSLIATP